MANAEPLHPQQQLRDVVRELPAPATSTFASVTLKALSLKEIDDRVVPGRPTAKVEYDEATFERVTLTNGTALWRYEGPVHVDEAALTYDGFAGRPTEWLRASLGPRCVSVMVGKPAGVDAVSVVMDFV